MAGIQTYWPFVFWRCFTIMKRTQAKVIYEIKWLSFIIIPLIIYIVFFLIPSLSSVFYSFTNWDGITYKFTGFENYINLFKEERMVSAFKNTIFFSVIITISQNVLALVLAICLNNKFKTVNVLRTIFFVPAIFSALVISFVWRFILEPTNGLINMVLGQLHLSFLQMDWVGDSAVNKLTIIFVVLWQYVGYTMVIYLAGLRSIPNEINEAAGIDGAWGLRKFINVTFPMLAPSFTVNIVLTTIGTLKIFDQIIAITGGGPGYTSQSIATTIYNLGFGPTSEWGYGTAMSIVMFVFIMILTIIQLKYLRKREELL